MPNIEVELEEDIYLQVEAQFYAITFARYIQQDRKAKVESYFPERNPTLTRHFSMVEQTCIRKVILLALF